MRPYKVPKKYKEHIEKLIQELLKDNFIKEKFQKNFTKESTFPYSSPTLQVRSKCTFVVPKIDYLGHVINAQGVVTDPYKI